MDEAGDFLTSVSPIAHSAKDFGQDLHGISWDVHDADMLRDEFSGHQFQGAGAEEARGGLKEEPSANTRLDNPQGSGHGQGLFSQFLGSSQALEQEEVPLSWQQPDSATLSASTQYTPGPDSQGGLWAHFDAQPNFHQKDPYPHHLTHPPQARQHDPIQLRQQGSVNREPYPASSDPSPGPNVTQHPRIVFRGAPSSHSTPHQPGQGAQKPTHFRRGMQKARSESLPSLRGPQRQPPFGGGAHPEGIPAELLQDGLWEFQNTFGTVPPPSDYMVRVRTSSMAPSGAQRGNIQHLQVPPRKLQKVQRQNSTEFSYGGSDMGSEPPMAYERSDDDRANSANSHVFPAGSASYMDIDAGAGVRGGLLGRSSEFAQRVYSSPALGGLSSHQMGSPALPDRTVLGHLRSVIGYLDPKLKCTLKDSLYRLSRTQSRAALHDPPAPSDSAVSVDKLVADLLYSKGNSRPHSGRSTGSGGQPTRGSGQMKRASSAYDPEHTAMDHASVCIEDQSPYYRSTEMYRT